MSNIQLPGNLLRHWREQSGVFSRRQAMAAGMSANSIDARVRRGTWQTVYPGVYRLDTGDLPRKARLWAALLYAGRGAVLSHRTAAHIAGFASSPGAEIHITIPVERRVRPQAGMRIHRSPRVFSSALIYENPPRTSDEETLLDLTESSNNFDEVYGWISDAISSGAVTALGLQAAMEVRSKLVWRSELTVMIDAAVRGDNSVLEHRYSRDVERRHKLPVSARQVPFTKPDGTIGRRDREYTEFGVVVELDGQLGHTGSGVSSDRARDRAAAVLGKSTIRLGWREVRFAACATAAEVASVLRNHGWTGAPRACGIACGVIQAFGA
jgi:hypothetical protein